MAQRTIMHIDLDAFFVSVEQALNPDLKGKPVVVGGRPGERGVISAASYEARKYGLHSAMPLVTAARLCPNAIFVQGNYARYREYSKRFMSILTDFSPFIEPLGLDEAYLDVTGFESLFGSIHDMAVAIKKRVADELDLCASIGISPCKVVSKIASDHSKPDGLVEIKPGEEAAFLAPMVISKLPGIGKQTEKKLHSLGINTLGELSKVPVRGLIGHFGSHGQTLHDHSLGIDDRKIEPPGTAKSISRETTFKEDIRDRTYLNSTLRYLGERVGADLRRRERRAKTVSIKIRFSDFTTATRSLTLPAPFDSNEAIFDNGLALLNKVMQSERRAVRLIGIGVTGIVEAGGQLTLLDDREKRQTQLNKTMDSIRDRYGFTSIQTGRTLLLKDLFSDTKTSYNKLSTEK